MALVEAALDAFIDGVLAQTGAAQVYAVGHSRGTTVWTSYLDDPGYNGAAKVAKYVNIDGRAPEALPGGVPTIGIWGDGANLGNATAYVRVPFNVVNPAAIESLILRLWRKRSGWWAACLNALF